MNPRRGPCRLIGLSLVVALSGAACSDAAEDLAVDIEELRADLSAQQAQRLEARTALDERIGELEAAVEALGGDDSTGTRLDQIDEQLTGLSESLTGLEADLAAESSARSELTSIVEAADQDLRSDLTAVREDLDALRGSISLLEDQVDVLRERVDRNDG